jgi:PAS domain S-box-containing protein
MPGNIHLLDLIEKERLDELLSGFTEVSGISTFIVDPDGNPISDEHNWTTLCSKYCRSTEEGRRRCYDSDRYGGAMSAKLKRRFIYPCLNVGLIDCTSPIIVGNYHIATFMCGQVLHRRLDENVAIQHAREIGIQEIDGYVRALRRIPIMRHARLNSIVNLMEVVTRTISELALSKYMASKQSRRHLDKLMNRISDGILSIDADGKISMVNEAFSRIIGYGKHETIGRSFSDFVSEIPSKDAYQKGLDAASQKGIGRASLAIDNADHRKISVQMSIAGIDEEEDDSGYVAVLRDMSEEVRIAQLKEDLIGMLTHDLGNPIFAIQKAMQLLRSDVIGRLNTSQEELIGLTIGTCQQLAGMVMDYLDIYRHENGKFRLRKELLDMRHIVEESIKQVRMYSDEKGVSIRYDPPPLPQNFMGDRMRVLRVLLNLLGNAFKFSPDGGKIEVRTRIITDHDEILCEAYFSCKSEANRPDPAQRYLLTEISDQGPGIPKKFQNAIFDKFFSLKQGDFDRRSGLGLGLAFCRLAVESHGGLIWVKSPLFNEPSSKRRGSRFCFALPAVDKVRFDSVGMEF